MIIVEGCDGTGKSTFIKKLSEKLELDIAPRVVSKDTTHMVDLKKWTEYNLKYGFDPYTIYDRHRLISDPIYRMVLNKPVDFELYNYEWLTRAYRRFKQISPIMVWCTPPYDVVKANLADDPDNAAIANKVEWLYHNYSAVAAQYLTDYEFFGLNYDYTRDVDGHHFNKVAALIAAELDRRAHIERGRNG